MRGNRNERRPRTAGSRRDVLAAAGATLAGTVAGCAALPDGESADDLEFDRLQRTAVYLDGGVDLSVPDDVSTASAPNNADLVVLPGDPDTDAEQAVDWLADERVLALFGAGAEGTWTEWVRSDAYAETFDDGGYGDAEPDPDLLVGAAVGLDVARYDQSWSDGPRDRDVLRALDETLIDIEERRSSDRRQPGLSGKR
ncbi:hypothetical protein G9464_10195 [Halostella sp. JP-L12]|uniref:hypothetical protein n=1 Tax=Halostella TaxID=1843185 RepID=UPI0013CE3E5D|nr:MULTISPECIES: hypothetical protein [Halostella]NHN47965.1 hypothetical protein [Halostella sp. JP-L12]